MSAEQLITQHIDTWTSALQTRSTAGRGNNGKIDLYGIKKLRELILELAVRGKLVPEDPNDEPASELLKRIAAEKAELVKQGKIKKQKPLAKINEDEKPFELPVGWEWVKLGNLGTIGSSSRVHQRDWKQEGIPFYRAREIVTLARNGEVSNELFISHDLFKNLSESGLSPSVNDIMLTGVGTIGVPYIVKENDIFYFKDASVLIFKNYLNVDCNYLNKVFHSKYWNDEIHKQSMGTTVHTLTISRANEVLIPLAPEKHQIKLVSKIEELMSLCDQLEQQSLTSLEAHSQLVEALLATLTNSQNAEELAENWARISQHFDTLFTTEASIDALKQTILQLAVMGKLVPQDPNDEPASELLKRIEQEKAQLVKKGKIKKQKPLPPVSDEEKPFELPEGWEWCRFEDIVDIQSGITKGRNLVGRELISVPYLRVANVQRGHLDLSEIKKIDIPADEKDKYQVKVDDLLITEGGDWDTVGRTAVWNDSSFYMANQNHVFKARPIMNELNVKWVEIFMNSSVSRKYFASASKQTTNLASINKTQLRGCFIALPPISESSRILDKYISLLNLFDGLKSQLQSAQQTQLHLANVLTDAALS